MRFLLKQYALLIIFNRNKFNGVVAIEIDKVKKIGVVKKRPQILFRNPSFL